MKRTSIVFAILLVISILLAACTLPFVASPAPVVQGTPNATLTALFDTSQIVPATNTPYYIVITATPVTPTVDLSTATSTATLEPTYTSTAEATVTNTTEPTATFTTIPPAAGPLYRPNAQLTAFYLSTAPSIDGTYAEWVDKTNKYTTQYFTWGKSNWENHADAEGVFAATWDSNYLYVGVKVTDDKHTQNNYGDQIYVGDAVEILIDTDLLGDFYTTSTNSDDYQLGLSAGDPSKGVDKDAYLWVPSSVKGHRSQVKLATIFESSTITRYEAAIPWSMMGVTPYTGMRLGFVLSIDDNDNVTDYEKVTMMSSGSGISVFNPTTWGELVLMK